MVVWTTDQPPRIRLGYIPGHIVSTPRLSDHVLLTRRLATPGPPSTRSGLFTRRCKQKSITVTAASNVRSRSPSSPRTTHALMVFHHRCRRRSVRAAAFQQPRAELRGHQCMTMPGRCWAVGRMSCIALHHRRLYDSLDTTSRHSSHHITMSGSWSARNEGESASIFWQTFSRRTFRHLRQSFECTPAFPITPSIQAMMPADPRLRSVVRRHLYSADHLWKIEGTSSDHATAYSF